MRNKPYIIYLGPDFGFKKSIEVLKDKFILKNILPTKSEFYRHSNYVEGIIDASMKLKFNSELLNSSKKLKIISCATTGSSHIDSLIVKKNKIELRTLKEDNSLIQNLTPAAELTWALLLACSRKLNIAFEDVKNNNWDREKFPGVMLKGKTIGIFGCGRIGTWISKYAQAFGMNVIGYDPFIDNNSLINIVDDLDYFRKESDFISFHIHLNDKTHGMIDNNFLKKCKKGVILINTSRGEIFNEKDLINNLENNKVASVGVDVLCNEPDIIKSDLFKYSKKNDNVLITPHFGGYSPDAVKLVCEKAAQKIKNYFY